MNATCERIDRFTSRPYLAYAAPWMLQGILLICATHGHVPFFGDSSDPINIRPGPISATAVYIIEITIWIASLCAAPNIKYSISRFSKERVLLMAYPVLAMFSVLWSCDVKMTIAGSFELLLLTATAIYIGGELRPEQQMQVFMVTGALAAIASLLVAGISPQEGIEQFGHIGALKGIFTQKNSCGLFMTWICSPAFYLSRTTRVRKPIVYGYLSLCILVDVLSQSRTAWVYLVFIVLFSKTTAILRRFKSRDAIVIAFASIGILFLAVQLVMDNLSIITELMGKDASLSGRTLIWLAVFRAVVNKPIVGYGYSAFFGAKEYGATSLASTTGFLVNHPHNGYLMILLDLGVVGMALVLMATIKAFADLRKVWRSNPYTDWYACLLIMTLVESISESSMGGSNDLSWMLFIVSCVALHRARYYPPSIGRVRETLPVTEVPKWSMSSGR